MLPESLERQLLHAEISVLAGRLTTAVTSIDLSKVLVTSPDGPRLEMVDLIAIRDRLDHLIRTLGGAK